MKILLLLICTLPIANNNLFAQNNKLDSLNNILKLAKHDTTRFNVYMLLGEYFKRNNQDTAIYLHTKAKEIAEKITGDDGELRKSESIVSISSDYYLKSDYNKVFENCKKSISIAEKHLNNKNKNLKTKANKLLALNFGIIGKVYFSQGDFSKALDNYFKALKIVEKINNKKGQSKILNDIGGVYSYQSNHLKALEYSFKSLKINEEIGNKEGMADNLGNIGSFYYYQDDYSKALDFTFRALKVNEEIMNKGAVASNLGNIGNIYNKQNDNTKALEYYFKALKKREEIHDKTGIAVNKGSIGALYFEQNKYALAEKYLKEAQLLNRELGSIYFLKFNCLELYKLYNQIGKHKEALHYYKEHILYRDSLNNVENQKASIQKEMQFNYEKKAAADSIANAKEKEIKNAEIAKHRAEIKAKKNQQYALYGGLFLVLVFAAFMYNRFKVTQKQKQIIEIKEKETQHQKELVEEKHKEIQDSINYAKRIQDAIMPSLQDMQMALKNGFILYQPKDVVAGDFFWMEKINNIVYFAAADCTGHGVPGAMVSVVCSNALTKSLLEEGIRETGKLLDRTRELVIERFAKSGEEVKDGMDISLCALNLETNELQWSGANNPLWIIRNNNIVNPTLIETKADKQPIGKSTDAKPFTTHQLNLENEDTIYIFTDGYADQFGGEKGKKFKAAQLKEIILNIQQKPLHEQKEILKNAFANWKGNLEQVDDVCIIGVKI